MSVYILSGARTPAGAMLGNLSTVPAPQLGAVAITAAIERANIDRKQIDEVFMGTVLPAGVGQNPARQASLAANIPDSVPCSTLNKVCGSGMKTVITAAQTIKCGDAELVVAGGMENMSLAPFLLPAGRTGTKFGATELKDHMQWDGLWDIYSNNAMGVLAEECPKQYNLSRQEQDEFAIESYKRAQKAIEKGIFKSEIAPVTIKGKKGDTVIAEDQGPYDVNFDKLPTLRPVFAKDGTITAANASTINDGGAALILGGEQFKNKAKFKIVAYASHAQNPQMFTTAPIGAIKSCLSKAQLSTSDIDLFEINEAFACVTLAAIKEFKLDQSKVNIYGGGCSLGHPIGQSGTRIIITLMNALERENKRRGLAAICIGGGEALSIIIERI